MGKLTKRDIEAAELPKARPGDDRRAFEKRWRWLGDEEVPGFGVKVYGSGLKVFAFRYRTGGGRGGRQRMLTLGRFGALTVQQARDQARKAKLHVMGGMDPQAERQRETSALKTVGDLMDRWIRDHAKLHRRQWKEDERRVKVRIKPGLGKSYLVDLSPEQVASWHRKIGGEAPYEANRCQEILRAAWRWAEREGLMPPGVKNPTSQVRHFRERSRDRWLKKDELARLMEAVQKEEDPYVRAAIPLLLLTGLRKQELLGARWAAVDMERAEIRLPETKSGGSQVRLLSPPAVALLRELPRHYGSPWIFPSPSDPKRPRRDIGPAWNQVRKKAGLEDTTLHDLRRTAGSFMAQAGVPLQVIGQVLGHSHSSVTEVYARLSSKNERVALETLARTLEGALGTRPGGNGGAPAAQDKGEPLLERLKAVIEGGAGEGDADAVVDRLRELLATKEAEP